MIIKIDQDIDKIQKGLKNQVLIKGKCRVQKGDRLELWQRTAKGAPRVIIGASECISCQSITINSTLKTIHIDYEKLTPRDVLRYAVDNGFASIKGFWRSIPDRPITGWLVRWDPEYITGRRLLRQIVIQGAFDSDLIEASRQLTASEVHGFADRWCRYCKRSDNCPVTVPSPQILEHEAIGACTVFKSKSIPQWGKDRKGFLELERKGQLNLLEPRHG